MSSNNTESKWGGVLKLLSVPPYTSSEKYTTVSSVSSLWSQANCPNKTKGLRGPNLLLHLCSSLSKGWTSTENQAAPFLNSWSKLVNSLVHQGAIALSCAPGLCSELMQLHNTPSLHKSVF